MSKVNREADELRQKIISWGKWQHQDCDPMCGDKAFEDIEITDCVRELDELLSQTRNDLLREIMEEMPKEIGVRRGRNNLYDTPMGMMDMTDEEVEAFNSAIDQVNTLLERKLSTVKK